MKKLLLAFISIATIFSVFVGIPAFAADDEICNGDFSPEQKQAAGCDIGDPEAETFNVVRNVLNPIYFVATIAAIGVIVFGGFRYSVSQGDPGKVKKAKDTIMYAIIGLLVVLSAFAITNFVLGAI